MNWCKDEYSQAVGVFCLFIYLFLVMILKEMKTFSWPLKVSWALSTACLLHLMEKSAQIPNVNCHSSCHVQI